MANLHEHLDTLNRLPEPEERRQIRQLLKLTQRQIADHLGVTSAAVASWESGQTPGSEHLAAYVKLLEELRSRVLDGGTAGR